LYFIIGQYRKLQYQRGDGLTENEINIGDILQYCVNRMGQVIMPILFSTDEIEHMSE